MTLALRTAMLLVACSMVPTAAPAGWVTTWQNTAVKQNGERMDPQSTSMKISDGRVRLEQPEIITVIDYNTERYTLINPTRHAFWSGTIDEYVREMGRNRAEKMREQLGEAAGKLPKGHDYRPPKIDPSTLPPVSITKTGLTEKIAGYETEKYQVSADGTVFQEIWVAPTLDLSSDLDPARYLAVQRKMSAAMMGKSAEQYNALYLNDQYRQLTEKAFILKLITHHMAGGFERFATSVEQTEVPADTFQVPATYRKVRLADVITTPPAAAPAAPPRRDS